MEMHLTLLAAATKNPVPSVTIGGTCALSVKAPQTANGIGRFTAELSLSHEG